MDTVSSSQSITRAGSSVTSTDENGVQRLDVLGGLVSVLAVTSRAVATAGGTRGSGAASSVAPVVSATTLTVDPAGLAALLPAGTPFLTVALVPAKAVAASRLARPAARGGRRAGPPRPDPPTRCGRGARDRCGRGATVRGTGRAD